LVCGVCRTDLHVVEGDLAQRRQEVVPGHQIVGRVTRLGDGVRQVQLGQRVGVAWLQGTCGHCAACVRGEENLCSEARFTGWTANGGYADYCVVPAGFAYALPHGFDDLQAAPLLCAGIIGYRSLRKTGIYPVIGRQSGARLGIYGFGAAGHVVIQLAKAKGLEVQVFTRDKTRHQALARELGADWVGDSFDRSGEELDAAIIFAPAGELVPPALKQLRPGGKLVLAGIHMSEIPAMDYADLYGERSICSVANNTRQDGIEFLREAAAIRLGTRVQEFAMGDANEALRALKHDAIKGAAVLRVADVIAAPRTEAAKEFEAGA
jgi:propanol-preferring alcohol dehydrogenase